jgi:hypothetical protein
MGSMESFVTSLVPRSSLGADLGQQSRSLVIFFLLASLHRLRVHPLGELLSRGQCI